MHPEQPGLTRTPTADARVPAQRGRTRCWAPDGPLDLALTLGPLRRGPGDPAFQVTPDGAVWRASRTPAGPGTIRIAAAPASGTVEAEAWGPGADWLLDGLPALLGADDDPGAFTARHRVVHEAHRRNPGLRLTRTGLVLESLIPSILEQKVTSDEAYRAWRLLLGRHGEPAPGPMDRMHVPPDARGWALIPSWEWHRAGVDNKRASTAVRAARVAPRLQEAVTMPSAEAFARLQLVPGIGPWTAAETLQRSNGDPDALTLGDLHLPNTVGYALTGAHRTTDATMVGLLEPYAGQRHRAARLILLTGRHAPRRGPRLTPGNIAAL